MACQIRRPHGKIHDRLYTSAKKNKFPVPVMPYSGEVNPPVTVVVHSNQNDLTQRSTFRHTIQTESNEYQMLDSLGKGAFGQVFLGLRRSTGEYVAVKVLRNRANIQEEVSREIYFLKKIKEANGSDFNLLLYHGAFISNDHYCLITEVLEQTLLDYVEGRLLQPLSLTEIRPILKQIYVALDKLQELQIIHTDIKPENIMFENTRHSPHKIKLVDFGNAISLDKVNQFQNLQTLYYRSPEIIVGAAYGHAIDIWSVGCIAAELYLGCILYKGYTPYDQIRAICETQGLPEAECLRTGSFTANYFNKQSDSTWELKTREEYIVETRSLSLNGSRYTPSTLDELFCYGSFIEPCTYSSAVDDRYAFIDLLKQMLSIDCSTRISPKAALQHTFITMTDLDRYSDCAYAKTSVEIMRQL